MDSAEVDFIGKMVLDEVMELFATVLPPAEAKTALKGFINTSKDIAQIEGARPRSCTRRACGRALSVASTL